MEDSDNIQDALAGTDETEAVNFLIDEASAAINAGEYRRALDGFRKALELAYNIFGESSELAELERTIAELSALLGD